MDILELLTRVGAILTDDHFVYTSGKHGSVYINKDALYPHTQISSKVGEMFAKKSLQYEPEVVVGPALGGIILSQWTAYHLSSLLHKEVIGVYTEKDTQKNQVFTRGYDSFVQNKRVLIVEDLATTGGSIQKVLQSVLNAGGNVVAIGVMINRNPNGIQEQLFQVPFFSLGELPAEAWNEADMPEWLRKRPVNTVVGHGKNTLQK